MCGVQARLASGEDVFGPLIQRFLLDNNHKVTVELLPDSKLGAIVEADEKKRLEVRSPERVRRIRDKTLSACFTVQQLHVC